MRHILNLNWLTKRWRSIPQPGLWLALLGLALALAGCQTPQSQTETLRGLAFDPPKAAPNFTLTDQQGRPFQLADQRGKVVLLYFGFAQCPDLCPTTLAQLSQARQALGRDAERVQVAFITVDPARDTQTIMANYVKAFDPTFVGLLGEAAEIEKVMQSYGAKAARRDLPGSALGYTMDHSSLIYVVDPAGRWRESFAYGTPVADIVADVRALLRSGRS